MSNTNNNDNPDANSGFEDAESLKEVWILGLIGTLRNLEYHFQSNDEWTVLKPLLAGVGSVVVLLASLYGLGRFDILSMEYYTVLASGISGVVSWIHGVPVLLFAIVTVFYTVFYLYWKYEDFTGGDVVSWKLKGVYYIVTGMSVGWVVWLSGYSLNVFDFSAIFLLLYAGSLFCNLVIDKTAFAKASAVTRERLLKEGITFTEASRIDGLAVKGFYPNVWRLVTDLTIIYSVFYLLLYFRGSIGGVSDFVFLTLPAIVNIIYFIRLGYPKLKIILDR